MGWQYFHGDNNASKIKISTALGSQGLRGKFENHWLIGYKIMWNILLKNNWPEWIEKSLNDLQNFKRA